MIFVKSILTKKRFVITFGAFLILAILLPTVYKYLATFQSGSSEPQNKSCYSVKFKIVSKGENFIDATESILVENINSGSLLLYFFKLNGIKHHVVKIYDDKNFVKINGVVTQAYQMRSPFFLSYNHRFKVWLEMPAQKSELPGNAIKQIASYLTFPSRSERRKEFFGEVYYDVKPLNKSEEALVIRKK